LQARLLTELADAARKGGGKAEALTPRCGRTRSFSTIGASVLKRPHRWMTSGENTRFVRGWCLEVHDLAIGKYVAGRTKDLTFNEALIRHGMLDRRTLESRLMATGVTPEIRELTKHRIARQFKIG